MGFGLSPLELIIIVVLAIVVAIPAMVFLLGMSIFRGKDDEHERRE